MLGQQRFILFQATHDTTLAGFTPANMQVTPTNDGWGTNWGYVFNAGNDTYTITSLGSDGSSGPPAPDPWINDPYTPDIALTNGQFMQAPNGQ